MRLQLYKNQIILSLLCLFYSVGLIGMNIKTYTETFQNLTPLILIITFGLFLWGNQQTKSKDWSIYALIFVLGFFIEMIGVQSGLLFGSYTYGNHLGIKILETPLVIGLNWLLLAITSFGIVHHFFQNPTIKIVCASLLMVLFDLILEPVAISLEFWTWENGTIPIQNYLMWFITALVLQWIIAKSKIKIAYHISVQIFVTLLIFFTTLNILL